MKTILALLILTASLHAQTWVKVATEGTSTASKTNTITLPAGTVYQFGTAGHFCDPVTVSKATTISPIYVTSFACTMNGVKTSDPANGVTKEVDVQQTAAAQTVLVNGTAVTVAAARKPVTCTSGTATTYTLTTSVTYNSGGFITSGSAAIVCQ